jgi:hypothetical protein
MNALTQLSSKQLRQAADIQDRIASLQRELESILGSSSLEASVPASTGVRSRGQRLGAEPRKRRKMSAAAKAKIATAARLRWKKARAAGKNTL